MTLAAARSQADALIADVRTKLDSYEPNGKSQEYIAWVLQLNIDCAVRARNAGSIPYILQTVRTLSACMDVAT